MKILLIILRVLITLYALLYTVFVIDEGFPPYDPSINQSLFGIAMIFVLYIWFLIGYYYLWTNKLRAGIFLITWFLVLYLMARWVWVSGILVVLGLPVFIFGILLLLYTKKKDTASAHKLQDKA